MIPKSSACVLAVLVGCLLSFSIYAIDEDDPLAPLKIIQELRSKASAEGVAVTLFADKTTVKLGEPILVSLDMKYTGAEPSTYDSQSVAQHDDFVVTGPDGISLPFVGGTCQTSGGPHPIAPQETVSLRKNIDLSLFYLFEKPGRYTVRFRGDDGSFAQIIFPPSNEIALTIDPGEMPPVDKLIAQVLPLCPKGWDVSKGRDNMKVVTPAQRQPVAGAVVYLSYHPTGLIADGSRVTLWQTDVPAELNSNDEAKKQYPLGAAEYLGKSAFGHLYACANIKPVGKPNWEDPMATLRTLAIPGK